MLADHRTLSDNPIAATPGVSASGLVVSGIDRDPGRVRLRLAGELDMATAARFDEALRQAFADRRGGWLEVDLGDVPFIDSSGIHVLVRWYTRAEVQGCRLVVTNVSDLVRHVLRLTGLLGLLGPPAPERSAHPSL